MTGLNKVQLIGNLGRDPEVFTMNNGNRVVKFSIACAESWRDKNSGERREKTEWVNIVIFGDGLGKVAENYLQKGSKVYVEGKFRTRKYEKDGIDRFTTEVVLDYGSQMLMLDSKKSGGGDRRRDDDDTSWGRPAKTDRRDDKEDYRRRYDDRDRGYDDNDRGGRTNTRAQDRAEDRRPLNEQLDDDIPF